MSSSRGNERASSSKGLSGSATTPRPQSNLPSAMKPTSDSSKVYVVERYSSKPPAPIYEARKKKDSKSLEILKRRVKDMLDAYCTKGVTTVADKDRTGKDCHYQVSTYDLSVLVIVGCTAYVNQKSGEIFWQYNSGNGIIKLYQGARNVVEVYEDVSRVMYWLFRDLEGLDDTRPERKWIVTLEEVHLILNWLWSRHSSEFDKTPGDGEDTSYIIKRYRASKSGPIGNLK